MGHAAALVKARLEPEARAPRAHLGAAAVDEHDRPAERAEVFGEFREGAVGFERAAAKLDDDRSGG